MSKAYSYTRVKKFREKNKIRAAYLSKKWHSFEKGIDFGLTFEFFEKLCLETGYHEKKSNRISGLQLDRINPELGYFDSNVQVLTMKENLERRRKKVLEDEELYPF